MTIEPIEFSILANLHMGPRKVLGFFKIYAFFSFRIQSPQMLGTQPLVLSYYKDGLFFKRTIYFIILAAAPLAIRVFLCVEEKNSLKTFQDLNLKLTINQNSLKLSQHLNMKIK